MILLNDRTDPISTLAATPHVTVSATGTWLDAEPGGEES